MTQATTSRSASVPTGRFGWSPGSPTSCQPSGRSRCSYMSNSDRRLFRIAACGAAAALASLGCGGEKTERGCSAVVALAGPGGNVSKHTRANVSAAESRSLDGAPLQFEWSLLAKPVGSAAALSATTGTEVSFDADAIGRYTVSLVATGSCTSTTTVQYEAVNRAPMSKIIANVPGKAFLQAPVTLTVSVSDPDGDPVFWHWEV